LRCCSAHSKTSAEQYKSKAKLNKSAAGTKKAKSNLGVGFLLFAFGAREALI
jgi:hypothetical protein